MKEIYFISPALPKVNCGVGDHVFNIIKSIKKLKMDLAVNIITSESDKIDPTFIASVFTGTLATFGVQAAKDVIIDRDYRRKIYGLTASDHAPVYADLDL